MNVVLISTYELGHQPFGLASPAAWLKREGAHIACLDLAVQRLDREAVAAADLIAFYVPMHTATRIAASIVERVAALNPRAHLCFFGLYAPVNASYLRSLGAGTILGGEFESGLVSLYRRLASGDVTGAQPEPIVSLARQEFCDPDRSGLPPLERYAWLDRGDGVTRLAGYTEASRGCKHLCRHCPIVPVYSGQFRVVPLDVVLEDVRQQVAAGAQHITFGDPDFFNGPGHALPLVEKLHRQFPNLTYDVTIKIEHLLKHARFLPVLRDTGCLFVTSAVESIDDRLLGIFDKRHTRADFFKIVSLFREIGLALCPTFVAFTPWTALEDYRDLLAHIARLGLVENVSPIQYAIRLLVPAGSKLLELPAARQAIGEFDEAALCYGWTHPDARMDRLQADILEAVKDGQACDESRREIFEAVWRLAHDGVPVSMPDMPSPQAPIPHLSEAWYC